MFLARASLVVFAVQGDRVFPRLGYTTGHWSWGSNELGNSGWLMPSNSLISTSYSANRSLSTFIGAQLVVFPYQIQPGTVLYVGLYLNGQLGAAENYTLKTSYDNPAYVLGDVKNGVANFSDSRVVFTVSMIRLKATISAGTQITVTAWASKPIWLQIDKLPLTHSYETSTWVGPTPPSVILPTAGRVAECTLAVGGTGS